MASLLKDVERLQGLLDACASNILLLNAIPQTVDRVPGFCAVTRMPPVAAEKAEAMAALEFRVVSGGDGTGGATLLGDVASLMKDEKRLQLEYSSLLALSSVDESVARALKAVRPTPAVAAFVTTLLEAKAMFSKRSMESKGRAGSPSYESRARARVAERDKALIEDEIARKRRKFEREKADMQASIDFIKKEIETLYAGANEQYGKATAGKAASMDKLTEAHATKEVSLAEQLARTKAEYAALSKACSDAEAALRMRVSRAAVEAETKVREYDAEMAAVQAKIDALEEARSATEEELVDFRAYFTKVGTELSVIGREEEAYYTRRVTEERKKAMSLARTCIKLQRWYRNKKKARLDKEAAEAAEAKKKKKATAKGDKKKKK